MKITQHDNQMKIYSSGSKNIISGIIFAIFGFSLTISSLDQSTSLWLVLFGCILGVLGIALLFFSKNKTVVLNKNEVILTDQYVIGGKPKQEIMSTADIIAVNLSTTTQVDKNSDGNTSRTRSSVLSLILRNNDIVKIGESDGNILSASGISINGFNLGHSITKAPLSNEATRIAAFLNVPLKNDYT